MQTPTSVKVSFWIFLVGLILDVISGVLTILAGTAFAANGVSPSVQGSAVGGGVFIAAGVIVLVFAAIQLLIVWKMKAGKNWARIVLTILEVLSLGSLFTGVNAVGIAAVVLGAIAVVLMWVPASNQYFRKS